jgi:hypothetical protein
MKLLLFLGFFLALTVADLAGSSIRPNYAGYRVLRMIHSVEVRSIIEDQSLSTWEASQNTGEIDVVVPPGMTAFDNLTNHVMHHDLGRSIATEAKFNEYGNTMPTLGDVHILTSSI